VRRHDFDPFSFVFGLLIAGLGLLFLFGNRTAADIGPAWIWPFPVLLFGLLTVLYAVKRLRAVRPADEPALPVEHEPPGD